MRLLTLRFLVLVPCVEYEERNQNGSNLEYVLEIMLLLENPNDIFLPDQGLNRSSAFVVATGSEVGLDTLLLAETVLDAHEMELLLITSMAATHQKLAEAKI